MAVDIPRLAFAQREYRKVTSEDLAIQTKHPLAVELEFNSMISSQSDAQTFGDYVLELRKLDRYSWELVVNGDNYPALSIGQTITVEYPRFGLAAGRNFIVKRIKKDSAFPFVELSLFGPQ